MTKCLNVLGWCTFLSLIACGKSEIASAFQAEDALSKVTLLKLPPSERFPAKASYFKLLLESKEIQALKTGLRTNDALADLQTVDYYLNFELRRDARLIQGSDTLYPTTFFREDYIAERPHETILIGFDLPTSEAPKFRLEGPLVAEALEIDLSSRTENSAR